MSDPEPSATGEDFHVEVSDVRSYARAPATPPARSPLDSRNTPRQRLTRLGLTAAVGLLVVAVVVSGVPALRDSAGSLLARLGPAPAPTIAFGADLFYMLPNPPGVDVLLDGRALAHLPFPGDPHPLRLARGRHVFAWRSRVLPFSPLRCTVSVPRAPNDSCPFVTSDSLPRFANLSGAIIAPHVSLAALASGDAASLTQTIQAALDTHRSTALVRPGEHYFYYQQGQAAAPVVARQPLRATLSYKLLTEPGYPEPCILGQPAIPCRFPGQDCTQFCTVTQLPQNLAGAANTWVVAVVVYATWDYATPGGQVVASQIGERFGTQLAVLRLTWDGGQWHAAAIFGHTPGLDVADDAICDPARYAIESTPSWQFMLADPPPGAQVRFVSDATPADGCVAVLDQAPGSGQAAVFLQRFGVLLTINDVAVNPVDNLPPADATEQQLAQHLLDQAQP